MDSHGDTENSEYRTRWALRTRPGCEPWTDSIWRQWETLEQLPGARRIKHNPARTVLFLPATPDRPSCYVKRYHIRGTFEKLKYMVVPSRALAEWRALCFLERQGLFVPMAWGMGEERQGGVLQRAGLIMEGVGDALPLPRFLDLYPLGHATRSQVLSDLGTVVGALHRAGASHGDLHAGNLLVQQLPGRTPRVCLLDLHTCQSGAVLPRLQRHGNLAKLLHSLGDELHTEEWLDLLACYRRARCTTPDTRRAHLIQFLERLRKGALHLERKRLGSRSRRCWKNTSEFRRHKIGNWHVHRRRDLDDRVLEALQQDRFEIEEVLKQRPGQRVLRISVPAIDGSFVLKERIEKKILSQLWLAIGGWGPLETAWWGARALDVRQVPTPRAWALLRQRKWGLPHKAWLLTDCVEGSTLRDALLDEFYPRQRQRVAELRTALEPLAASVRRLHDTGIYHRDLNPLNVLVEGGAFGGGGEPRETRLQIIDLDSIRPLQRPHWGRQLKNLVQLATLPEGHIRRGDLLWWLRKYAEGDQRFLRRSTLRRLREELARETLKIVARISHKERHHPLDPEVCDMRFRQQARHLTGAPPESRPEQARVVE